MFSTLLAFTGMAGSRLVLWGLALAIWLLTRPGGWAVLAAATLVALQL
ncbi:hypothetical protein [Phaeovulum sp.]